MIRENGLESKVCVVPEPIELWERFLTAAPQGRRELSALELYYQDPERLSYPFQIYVLITLQNAFNNAVTVHTATYGEEPSVVICERFQNWVARNTFIQDFVDREFWTLAEKDFYDTTWNYIVEAEGNPTPFHWYITASPQTCSQRIHQRARGGENLMSFETIRRLHTLYHAWSRSLDTDDRVLNTEMNNDLPRNRIWYYAWVTKEVLHHVLQECTTFSQEQIAHYTHVQSLAADVCVNVTPDLI